MTPFGAAGVTGAAMLAIMAQAEGQTLQHPPHGQHDPYQGMTQPGTGISCCHGRDCGVAQACVLPSGEMGFREEGACHVLPDSKLVPMPSGVAADLVVCRTRSYLNRVYTPDVLCWAGGAGT